MNLAEVLNTITLLLPGYFGAWAMSFVIGVRRREWQQAVLYSLLFSAASYLILLRLSPLAVYALRNSTGIDLTGFQRALNGVSNLGDGDPNTVLVFHDTIKVIGIASLLSLSLGFAVGRIRRSKPFRSTILRWTNRTQNVDIWTDFHERYDIGPHSVQLKNGDVYYGQILMVSDTFTGGDRGIIIDRPLMIENPIAAGWKKATPGVTQAPGHVLVFADQIASIANAEDPQIVRRTQRMRHVRTGNSRNNRKWRRFRKWLRRIPLIRWLLKTRIW
jgi:Family of unknown function (DUF6338)